MMPKCEMCSATVDRHCVRVQHGRFITHDEFVVESEEFFCNGECWALFQYQVNVQPACAWPEDDE